MTLCVTDGWGAREQDGFESLMREEFPLLAEDASLLEGLFSALGAAWRQRLCLLPAPPSPPHRQPSRALFVTSAALMWAGVAAASRVRAAAVCLWGRRHRVRSPVLASWAG
eukprot:SAG25_NODE_117_length_14819_cov_20.935670_18_plen_111_part_00